MQNKNHFDVCIAGAGIIGLTLAMELKSRGASVLVLEQGRAMREASWAAGGMLAALDPANPPSLQPLAHLSLKLYPEFLNRISELSGHPVRIRTATTLLASLADNVPAALSSASFLSAGAVCQLAPAVDPGPFRWVLLDEPSLDPRDLCHALPVAVRAMGIEMREETAWLSTQSQQNRVTGKPSVHIETTADTFHARAMVHCTGAWASSGTTTIPALADALRPRKGQMLCLRLPADTDLRCVVHAPGVYIVPRGDGRVVIGSTIEDCGFDKSVSESALTDLLARAARLVPALTRATEVERWAGLRPGSPDALPVMGAIDGAPGSYINAGHFRMGLLLAPASARLMAQLLLGQPPDLDLAPYAPLRIAASSAA